MLPTAILRNIALSSCSSVCVLCVLEAPQLGAPEIARRLPNTSETMSTIGSGGSEFSDMFILPSSEPDTDSVTR
jgi:hypothetical protein